MTCFDDCYDCHWRVTAGVKPLWKIHPGQSGGYVDEWCGAGRVEFNTDGYPPCPMRLEITEIEVYSCDHEEVFADEGTLDISDECRHWLAKHMPNTSIDVDIGDLRHFRGGQSIAIKWAVLRFEYPQHAILFKLRWL